MKRDALNAVICWTETSPADRIKKLVPLLKSLRLGLLKPSFISKLLRNPLFKLDNDAFNFAADLVEYSLSEDTVQLDFEVSKKPRLKQNVKPETAKLVIVGGRINGQSSRSVQAFDIEEKTWSCLSDLPIGIAWPCTAVIENCMYVVGGENNNAALDSTYCYNTSANEWCRKADMQTPRVGHSLVAIGEKLIAVGGCTSGYTPFDDQTKSVEAFDSVENKWSALSELPSPISCSTACASHTGNYVYCFGGLFGYEYSNIVIYNVFTDTWTRVDSTDINFWSASSTQLGERIFIFGGYENGPLRSVWEFFPDQKKTVRRKEMPRASSFFSVCPYKSEIFVLGGTNNDMATHIESYDVVKDKWATVAKLEQKRCRFGASILQF